MIPKFLRRASRKVSIKRILHKCLNSIVPHMTLENNITYEGIYRDFADARTNQSSLTGYLSEKWLEIELQKLDKLVKDYNLNLEIEGIYRERDLLLVIAGLNVEKIKILDIGSGFANTYFYLKKNLNKKIEYKAVEIEEIALALNEKLNIVENFSAFVFNTIPIERFDLIYFGSSLQYIEDYENLLIKICQLKAPKLFISDTPMGSTKKFATVQVNMASRRIPSWVFCKEELINMLGTHGYNLVAESLVDWHQQIHNFDNFPFNYSQIRNRNLLFEYKS